MSSIDKMLIKGIRSFSPDNQNVIEFFKPLTLIVGHNGAGKTTVIECLKMATTGDLPPNTRSGQNFVHDPKIAGETEVKAQIKLRFHNATNKPFIVVRCFQLTQKKASLQFKALDNSLTVLDDATGEMTAMTNRCGEINTVVPALMGVSKAILENVIFVHQEDSNWPLAEGPVLKKRFDDIFAATKYTKALEELRKMKSKQVQEAKEMRLKLETLKTHKDHAARLKTTLAESNERSQALRTDIQTMEQTLRDISKAKDDISEKLNSMADFTEDIVGLKARYDTLAVKNAEAYARLVVTIDADDLEMSREELEEYERSLGPKMGNVDRDITVLEREIQSSRLRADALRTQRDKEMQAQSRLVAEAEAHLRNITDRDNFLRDLSEGTGGADGNSSMEIDLLGDRAGGEPLSESAAEALKARFRESLDAARRDLEEARVRAQREDDELGRQLDELAAHISGAAEGRRMKEEAQRQTKKRLQEVTAAIDDLESLGASSTGALESAQSLCKNAQTQLHAKEEELKGYSAENHQKHLAEQLFNLASNIETLRGERKALAARAEEASKMNFNANELKDAEEKQERALRLARSAFASALGIGLEEVPAPGQELVNRLDAVVKERQVEADSADTNLKTAQEEASRVRGSLEAMQMQANRAKTELESLTIKLQEGLAVTKGNSLLSEVSRLEEKRKVKAAKAEQNTAYLNILDQACLTAEKDNACLTCSRPFESVAQRDSFLATKRGDKEALPRETEKLRNAIQEVEEKLKRLKILEPLASRQESIQNKEIPELERAIKDLQSKLAELEAAVESATSKAAVAAQNLSLAREAQQAASPLLRGAQDILKRRHDVDAMRASLMTNDAATSVASIDTQLAELEQQRTSIEKNREEQTTRLATLRDAIAELRSKLHNGHEEVRRLGAASEKRKVLQAQEEELVKENDRLAQAVLEGQKIVKPLEERKAALVQRREEARGISRTQQAELEAALRALQTQETQLEARERALIEYSSRGAPAALAKAEELLATLKSSQNEAEAECRRLLENVAALRAEAADSEGLARQVADILTYRRSKDEEIAIATKLDDIGAAMANVGDRGALSAEFRSLEHKEREVRSESDRAAGALATVQEAADAASTQLRAKEYTDIEGKYRRQLIELRTTEMASGDLEKYHKALERALLSFHTAKMSDINKTIKELWQKTYRNSDIDYIQLKADVEGGSAARSYNYRVIMVVGGTELDMRGRCSAGQRVLACLVIRLALAETFCLNCGILALDEPTTNLDSENAASLAEALKSVMTSRREQENFQLVVITHDEAFARLLGTREHTEHMWRIAKDENQHSTVIMEDIAE